MRENCTSEATRGRPVTGVPIVDTQQISDMKLIVKGSILEELIIELTSKHDEVSFAVAWSSYGTSAFTLINQHREKIRRAVIGTHFYQTHPDVLVCLDGKIEHDFAMILE